MVVPVGLAKADGPITADQVRAQVLALANQLLGDNRPPLTAGEWIERKAIARSFQAVAGGECTPWLPWELEVMEERAAPTRALWLNSTERSDNTN